MVGQKNKKREKRKINGKNFTSTRTFIGFSFLGEKERRIKKKENCNKLGGQEKWKKEVGKRVSEKVGKRVSG